MITQHQPFSKECFQKDAKCRRMLDQTHLVSKSPLFSDVSASIKTKHEDACAWEEGQKSTIVGSFRDISMKNKQTENWAGFSWQWVGLWKTSWSLTSHFCLSIYLLSWEEKLVRLEARIFFGTTFNQQAGLLCCLSLKEADPKTPLFERCERK